MKKQIVIFISLVFILIIFNKVLFGGFGEITSFVDKQDLLNTKQVKAQKLFDDSWAIIKRNYYDPKLNEQNWKRWKEHYNGKIKTDEDANVAINTMLESLNDPYSKYLDKENYAQQNTSIDSKITGVGINIASVSGKTLVISVIEGSPAEKAGVKAGDIIFKVDGKDISGMKISDVVSVVRGEIGTKVKLTILRKKQVIIKTVPRDEIKIKTVKSSIYKNIGYIQIMTFIGNTTPSEFITAVEKTDKAEGLIIDLRGNTGGLLPNAVFIANMFINKGTLVSIVGRNGYKQDINAQSTDYVIEKPMLVLVDGGSASASEILSGALKDYHRAKLIGTKTYGKGMVQRIIPMPNETGINLTTAIYLTPMGHNINKKGIEPDIKVELTEQDIIKRHDVQLDKAKLILAKMIDEEKH